MLELVELGLRLVDLQDQLALFVFALVEFFEERRAASGVCDGVGETVDLEFELGALFVELVEQGCRLCHGFGLVGEQGIAQLDHVFGAEDVCNQLVQNGALELFFWDPERMAIDAVGFLFGGAGVVAVGVILCAAVDGFAGERGSAHPTAQEAGEDVVTGFGTRMVAEGVRVILIGGEGVLVDHLDLLPGGAVDNWLTVVFDDGIAVAHDADVDLIGEKVGPGVFALVEAGFFGELVVGRAQGSQRKGALDERYEFGIRFPAVDDVRFSIPAGAKGNGFGAFEAARGCAADGFVLGDVVLETAFDIGGEILQVAGVHPVDGGFEKTAVETLGDGFVEGVDDVATPSQVGFVVLGVVDFAGEAGEFPDENAGFLDRGRGTGDGIRLMADG